MSNPEHKDTLRCAKRDGKAIFGPDGIEPVGFTGSACKCRLWQKIPTAADTAANLPPKIVEGCFFDTYLWVQNASIRKANHAALMAIEANKQAAGLRKDIGLLVQQLALASATSAGLVDITLRSEALRGVGPSNGGSGELPAYPLG
jgi:hypothetical protein